MGVTPVHKVLDMLKEMLSKAKKEKHAEAVQYNSYKQFCDDTVTKRQVEIKEGKRIMESLLAAEESYGAKARNLERNIGKLDEDIAVWTGDLRAAAKVRELEKEDYKSTHTDYEESIDALGRAVEVLQKQDSDRPQALIQLQALKGRKIFSGDAEQMIDSFLDQTQQQSQETMAVQAPEADGYEFHSEGVIEMLVKLKDKFVLELRNLERDEILGQQSFELLTKELREQMYTAKGDREEAVGSKANKLQKRAGILGEYDETGKAVDADVKYVKELSATCTKKEADFEARQALRVEEIQAIEKATEIISSAAVQGNAKHLTGFLEDRMEAASFSQLRVQTTLRSAVRQRLAAHLRRAAVSMGSRAFDLMADSAASDPFQKVKKMIQELIVRLMEEANEDAEHNGWCEKELRVNKKTRTEKSNIVESIQSEIDELEASISKMSEQGAETAKVIAAIGKAMEEATTLRQNEKVKNAATIEDAQEAQQAVEQAITVLQQFYEKSGEATVFAQEQDSEHQQPPKVFNDPYKGLQGDNEGVVGMLQVIQGDFARLESDTAASEASSQKEYDAFMSDSAVDKSKKMEQQEFSAAKKQDHQQALIVKKEDLDGTQKELDAALAYFDKLKPTCVGAGSSYQDRVERRKNEIQSLQEALRIMNGEDI